MPPLQFLPINEELPSHEISAAEGFVSISLDENTLQIDAELSVDPIEEPVLDMSLTYELTDF